MVTCVHECVLLISFSLLSYQILYVLVLHVGFEILCRKTQYLKSFLETH